MHSFINIFLISMKTKTDYLINPLTGKALLERAQQLEHLPKAEMIIECGYTRTDGRPSHAEFWEAYLSAKGVINNPSNAVSSESEVDEQIDYFIDVPLQTTMRIAVRRPKTFTKQEVLDSVCKDDLGQCQPLTGWDCVKYSWHVFINSGAEPCSFSEDVPPVDDIIRCLSSSQ